VAQPIDSKTNQYQGNNLETLLEQLGSLRIIEENILNEAIETETIDETSIAPVPAVQNEQVVMPKSMVPDPEWFNRNRTKFED